MVVLLLHLDLQSETPALGKDDEHGLVHVSQPPDAPWSKLQNFPELHGAVLLHAPGGGGGGLPPLLHVAQHIGPARLHLFFDFTSAHEIICPPVFVLTSASAESVQALAAGKSTMPPSTLRGARCHGSSPRSVHTRRMSVFSFICKRVRECVLDMDCVERVCLTLDTRP